MDQPSRLYRAQAALMLADRLTGKADPSRYVFLTEAAFDAQFAQAPAKEGVVLRSTR